MPHAGRGSGVEASVVDRGKGEPRKRGHRHENHSNGGVDRTQSN